MSYSQTIKKRLCVMPEKSCCRRAYILGFLVSSCIYKKDGEITLQISGKEPTDFVCRLIGDAYREEARAFRQPGGGSTSHVQFKSKSAERYLSEIENHPDYDLGSDLKCEGCRRAFITGIFLGAGQVSDPEKDYRIDISPKARHTAIYDYLSHIGVMPKVTQRKGKPHFYYCSIETVSDFFAVMGEVDEIFRLSDVWITHEVFNNTNRINNLTYSNLDKTVSAVEKTIALLVELEARHLLTELPDELREAAYLRLQNQEMSLSELAKASNPPITKSGFNHRLKKVLAFAEEKLK